MSTLNLPQQDDFEDRYTAKLRQMLAGHGVIVQYDRDRAALDIGVHLAKADAAGAKRLTTTKVWFQLKGVHSITLPLPDFEAAETVSLDIRLDQLRFWYASPEAIYLVLYVESADVFLAEDVRDIVDREWGDAVFSSAAFRPGQVEVRVHLRASAVLDEGRIKSMLSHQSMRIDRQQWRGRPLGHRIDPLRSEMSPMPPDDFRALVERLLEVHRYELQETLDAGSLLGGVGDGTDRASLTRGRMHYTYEWTNPLFTEFGYGPGETFRIEGEPFFVQGPCVVLIHEQVGTLPGSGSGFSELGQRLRDEHQIGRLLVFANHASLEPKYFGASRQAASPLECMPQDLGSLAFNVLTATTVYLEFRDRITWRIVNYLG